MTLKVSKINDNIILVNSNKLPEYFLRFQEYYESPKWKGKVFTLGQFRNWYAETNGAFTYYTDWSGFNVPGYVFDVFKTGIFDPLTDKEQELLNLFKDRTDEFYVIGAKGQDKETIKHEICHGLYYTNLQYRDYVDELINVVVSSVSSNYTDNIFAKFKEMGYHQSVWNDELNAYYATNIEPELDGVRFYSELRSELQEFFNNEYEKLNEI